MEGEVSQGKGANHDIACIMISNQTLIEEEMKPLMEEELVV